MVHPKYNYETTVIINAALEDNQVESVVGRIQETVAKHGGEISAVNRWGRKRLAYPIKKKNNGYFLNLEFTAPGEIVRPLEGSYLLDEQILRFLTIKLDEKALKAKELRAASILENSLESPVTATIPGPAAAPASPAKEPLFETETPA